MRRPTKRDECWALWHHACLLRAATRLAASRQEHLSQTLNRLGLSTIPEGREELTRLQVETAKEIGGIRTMMVLDAPEEIEKYHWGPFQIALCLLAVAFKRYEQLGRTDQWFQDDGFDAYRRQHQDFVNRLDDVRDSLLHQRYENLPTQGEFVDEFRRGQAGDPVALLVEGVAAYEGYVRRMGLALRGEHARA